MSDSLFSSRFRIQAIAEWGGVGAEIGLALLIGFGLAALGAGEGAWILGGIGAGAIAYWLYQRRGQMADVPAAQLQPNRSARKVGQMLTGLTVGVSVQFRDLAHLLPQLPVFVGCTLLLLALTSAIGLLYARLQKTDLLTALLATMPGNIGVMASIAADYQKDAALVSLVQLLRFTAVTLVVPTLVDVEQAADVGAIAHRLLKDWLSFSAIDLLQVMGVVGLAALAALLGSWLRVPVAAFFCPILVGAGLNLGLVTDAAPAGVSLPLLLKLLGQILLGLTIGQYWALNPPLKRSEIAAATVPALLTLAIGFLLAGVAAQVTAWDGLTCLLVTAPGGSPEMIWIALALHHDVEIVTAGHLVRLLMLNLLLPLLVTLSRRLDRSSPAPELS